MKAQDIERFKQKLVAFLADLVQSMGRTERRRYTEMYIRGLLMDGERKSIEPMVQRVPDGGIQALQQFVNQSPWSHQAGSCFFGQEGREGICTGSLLDR